MRVGERYSLVPIYTEFPQEEKSFISVIKRVDIVGKWILVLSELKPSKEKKNEIFLSVKIPYRFIERETVLARHYIITNGLLSKKNITFSNVYPIKTEKDYQPDKVQLPVDSPSIIYGQEETQDYLWMDDTEEEEEIELDNRGRREKCVVM